MDDPSELALLHQGWDFLRTQRPLAAWAAWQRVLRVEPNSRAAHEALSTLAGAGDLPEVARIVHRFRAPADAQRRERWNACLAEGDLEELERAERVFAELASADADDAEAKHNRALCLAWLGRNAEAIAILGDVATRHAESAPDRAIDAVVLAELLRFGAGAEHTADDLRYLWTISWPPEAVGAGELADHWPGLRAIPIPDLPFADARLPAGTRLYEWLDPFETPDLDALSSPAEVPRVLATVIQSPGVLRLSAADPTAFERLEDPEYTWVSRVFESARREATPQALAFADAPLAQYRIPEELPLERKQDLARAVVERYHEDEWIHRPRQSLGGLSPLQAARNARRGDSVARVRLAGVVRFREQLGIRPSLGSLYLGYPFDRLRRRLELVTELDPNVVDPVDIACMSGEELDALDPDMLDDSRLAEAVCSALGLREDARTARFATAMLARRPGLLRPPELEAAVATLTREALRVANAEAALAWLDRARRGTDAASCRETFAIWSAEVLLRDGRPEEARDTFRSLIQAVAKPRARAIRRDAVESLDQFGFTELARSLEGDPLDEAK